MGPMSTSLLQPSSAGLACGHLLHRRSDLAVAEAPPVMDVHHVDSQHGSPPYVTGSGCITPAHRGRRGSVRGVPVLGRRGQRPTYSASTDHTPTAVSVSPGSVDDPSRRVPPLHTAR